MLHLPFGFHGHVSDPCVFATEPSISWCLSSKQALKKQRKWKFSRLLYSLQRYLYIYIGIGHKSRVRLRVTCDFGLWHRRGEDRTDAGMVLLEGRGEVRSRHGALDHFGAARGEKQAWRSSSVWRRRGEHCHLTLAIIFHEFMSAPSCDIF
jgi:hypothetical protein